MFFIETKLHKKIIEAEHRKVGFVQGFDVVIQGTRGGLSIGWKDVCSINMKSYLTNHIGIVIEDDLDGHSVTTHADPFFGSRYRASQCTCTNFC